MRYRIGPLAIAGSILLSPAALAAPNAKACQTSVTFKHPMAVAGQVLPAGTYRLEFDADLGTARFTQGKSTVAETAVKVGVERAVYPGTAVHSRNVDGRERLTKIVLADSGVAIAFPTEPVEPSTASVASPPEGS